jgi:Tfp pilus tip-associated adhesin PilY1
MNSLLPKVNLLAGATVLALAVWLVILGSGNQTLQAEAQSQVLKIRTGQQTQQITGQVATNIVKDMAQLSLADSELRGLLQKHGFTVQVRQPAAPSAAN